MSNPMAIVRALTIDNTWVNGLLFILKKEVN